MKPKPNFISNFFNWIAARRELIRQVKYLKVENKILKTKVVEQNSTDKS